MMVISLKQVQNIFKRKDGLAITKEAFIAQSTGKIITPPPLVFDIPCRNGEICIKTAFVKQLQTYTIKQVSFFDNGENEIDNLQ